MTKAEAVRQQAERTRLAQAEAVRQQAERTRLAQVEAARQQEERERLAAQHELPELYLTIRNVIAHYNDSIKTPIHEILEILERYSEGNTKLLTAISKRIKNFVNGWNALDVDTGTTYFEDYQNNDSSSYARFMISCKKMVNCVLDNKGVPSLNEVPQNLKVNPWMVNSPYFDLMSDQHEAQESNVNDFVDEAEFNQASSKIVNLFRRLTNEQKITPLRLLDYEALSDEQRVAFQNINERFDAQLENGEIPDIVTFFNEQNWAAPQGLDRNGSKLRHFISEC